MNIIIGNKQENQLNKLDIDIIKNVVGCYEASVLVEMFKTFFYNKIVLDVTALKDYEDINSYKKLISGIEADKIIFYMPENTNLCTAEFLYQLVNLGIYNFTSNLEGIKYLINHSNSYKEVEYIKKLVKKDNINNLQNEETKNSIEKKAQVIYDYEQKIIGFRNVTSHAGATTLIYMLKKELAMIFGINKVLAIEINKSDFSIFIDKEMISLKKEQLKDIIKKAKKYKVILIDLNDYPDNSVCDEVCYLVEPSIIKLNKLIRINSNVFEKLKGRKLILNKSLLSEKEISSFEAEAKIEVFYNIPALNERKRNDVLYDFLEKLELVSEYDKKDNKVFGLFRR